jgi:hypothetical protein
MRNKFRSEQLSHFVSNLDPDSLRVVHCPWCGLHLNHAL